MCERMSVRMCERMRERVSESMCESMCVRVVRWHAHTCRMCERVVRWCAVATDRGGGRAEPPGKTADPDPDLLGMAAVTDPAPELGSPTCETLPPGRPCRSGLDPDPGSVAAGPGGGPTAVADGWGGVGWGGA